MFELHIWTPIIYPNFLSVFFRSRKLSTQLEKAIQEAMAELDKKSDQVDSNESKANRSTPKNATQPVNERRAPGRLRSSQR